MIQDRNVIKAESTKFSPFIPAEACIAVLNPMLSIEISCYPFTDFISSQLQMEGTIGGQAFPNFQPYCFAPVLHRVMHTVYNTASLLAMISFPFVHTSS
jgi:hypothetical protein